MKSSGTRPFFCRSARVIAAGAIFLALPSCGVDFNGLFDGTEDGGDGAAQPDANRSDAGQDARPTDVSPDSKADVVSTDAAVDMDGGDARNDVSVGDGSGPADTSVGGDVKDATVDKNQNDAKGDVVSDDTRDAVDDPVQDMRVEDAVSEIALDTPRDSTIDVGIPDGFDAGPPGSCTLPCNTIVNIGQEVMRTVDMGAPPAMTGGTIVDGTYVATSAVNYDGDTEEFSISETSVISGNLDAWVSSTNGAPPMRYMTTFTATNNQMSFAICCPNMMPATIVYTTDGVTLSHVDPLNSSRVITYTRQ